MGLDFTIYWEEKDNPIDFDSDNFTWAEWEKHELCYGRKSWELVHFLNLPIPSYREDDDKDPELKKEDWVNLMKAIEPIADKLEEIRNAYYAESHYEDHGGVPRDIQDLMVNYEVWYDKTFDEAPTLGYDFSVGYISEFYEAKDEVLRYLDDDKYTVKASISY